MKQHKFAIADYKRCIGCATWMRPVFVVLMGAVSFQKLDQQCSVKQKAS